VYSKSTAAGPGDYPKRRGALAAFYSACRHADLLKQRAGFDRQTV